MKINKSVGESCLFSGGNEVTPKVEVLRHQPPPLSLQDNVKVLRIEQNGQSVIISAETLQSILNWANKSEKTGGNKFHLYQEVKIRDTPNVSPLWRSKTGIIVGYGAAPFDWKVSVGVHGVVSVMNDELFPL